MAIDPLLMLASIMVLGALAQWLGWALRLPSILLLLLFGFLAGPIAGVVKPDDLFGDLLLPFVSVSVALILFEGGLTLNVRELRGVGRVVLMLVTLGALITWILAAAAAYWLIGLEFGISVLLGAILTVTGPTVVLPLLRHIRPLGAVNSILKWEGIVIDPVGAVLAVIAFEVIAEGRYDGALPHAALTVSRTLLLGSALGLAGAGVLVIAIRRFWIPDHLHTLVATMLVVAIFAGSNWLLHESGLMAVTVMGIALANQRFADVRHILEFKENLRVFLLSAVFVLLSARLKLADLASVGIGTAFFLLALLLVVRPACVLVSTIGSRLEWRERAFLAWMAPRGIVAAAVTSVFALALEKNGLEQARLLVPIVFSTIVGTVLVYGLTSGIAARRLKLADPDPQGLLILGAGTFARELARAAKSCGFRALLVDTNRENIIAAQMAGLATHYGSALADDTLEKLDLSGIGRLLALTSNDEVNTLAVQRFAHIFGRANLFQLPPKGSETGRSKISAQFHGRLLFGTNATLARIDELLARHASIRTTRLSAEFDYQQFRQRHGDAALPLLVAAENGRLAVLVAGEKVEARPGRTLISLLLPAEAEQAKAAALTPTAAVTPAEATVVSGPDRAGIRDTSPSR
ncbi:MAG: cation:proton antiporter [Phycisphaerae bacterium]